MLLEIKKLVFAVVVCQLAGVLGSLFTYPQIPTWYASLKRPGFSPPNWLFAPVWITNQDNKGLSAYGPASGTLHSAFPVGVEGLSLVGGHVRLVSLTSAPVPGDFTGIPPQSHC